MAVEKIEALLKEDPEKEKAFKQALDSEEARNTGSDAGALCYAASCIGLEITPEEVERDFAESFDVDEDELKHVAGGASAGDKNKHNRFCVTVWHCYTALLHPENNDKIDACWSDYTCMTSEHAKDCKTTFISCFHNVNDKII